MLSPRGSVGLCRGKAKPDIIGHPRSGAVAKLGLECGANFLQILGARATDSPCRKSWANVSSQSVTSPGSGVGRGISAMLSTRNPARSSRVA